VSALCPVCGLGLSSKYRAPGAHHLRRPNRTIRRSRRLRAARRDIIQAAISPNLSVGEALQLGLAVLCPWVAS
jgi:hypothetical protein